MHVVRTLTSHDTAGVHAPAAFVVSRLRRLVRGIASCSRYERLTGPARLFRLAAVSITTEGPGLRGLTS